MLFFVLIKNHQSTSPLPPTTHSPSPQPTIRPMYPSPASAYRPQVPQQPQLIPQPTYPQMTNQNSQPPPPPPSHLSTYPHPQYSNHSAATANIIPPSTSTYPGHPGQSLPFPQPMPYGMGGSTAGTSNQQINNINGPFLVNIIVDKLNFIRFFYCRTIIII